METEWLFEANPLTNDHYSEAIPLQFNVPFYGTTIDMTGDDISSCGMDDHIDAWFILTPPRNGQVSINTCCPDCDLDTVLSVYTLTPMEELVEVPGACNDDDLASCGEGSYQSQLLLDLEAETDYLIRVAGYNNATGEYRVHAYFSDVPPNDESDNAIEVFDGVPFMGTTLNATGTNVSSCSTNDIYDVWHTYTPPVSDHVTFSLCGSDFDTTLSIHDESTGEEIPGGCNDDNFEACGEWNYQSQLTIFLDEGITYLIRVAGYNGDSGNYILEVN